MISQYFSLTPLGSWKYMTFNQDNLHYHGKIYRILERCLEDLMSQEEEEKCLSMTPMVLESSVSRSSLALAMHWPGLTSRRMVTVTSTASNEAP